MWEHLCVRGWLRVHVLCKIAFSYPPATIKQIMIGIAVMFLLSQFEDFILSAVHAAWTVWHLSTQIIKNKMTAECERRAGVASSTADADDKVMENIFKRLVSESKHEKSFVNP